MAGETPSTQEGLSQHPFVERLMPDPAKPAPATVQFEGLLGKSTRGEDYWRLYLDRDLSNYIEFKEDDVLNSETIAKEHSSMELESTRVWLRRDAEVTRTHSQQMQAEVATEAAYDGYVSPSVPAAVLGPPADPYGGRYQLDALPQGPFSSGLRTQGQVAPNAQKVAHIVPDYRGNWLGTARVTEASGGVFQVGNTGRISMSITQSGTEAGVLADVTISLEYRDLFWNLPSARDVVEGTSAEVYGPLDFWTHPHNRVTGESLYLANHWIVRKPSTYVLSVDCRIWHPSGYFNCRIQGDLRAYTSTPHP